ncbi:MAG TPA: alpha/beta hydrolase [Mycobacteriales bacterium]|jgi:pimeloyl-ACP methyl ester carboxylesterase
MTDRTTAGRAITVARLSDLPLPHFDPNRSAWPSQVVQVDGRGILLRPTPPTAAGAEPALYVHGLGGSSTNWTDLAALLADRVDGEALDLPGFGGSDPAPGGDYALSRHAATVSRLIESRDRGPVHLLGNSLGGAVAVLVAADRPDLVRTLTLVSPAMPDLRPRRGPTLLLGSFVVPGVRRLAEWRIAGVGPEERVRTVIDVCFADPSIVPPARLAETVEEVRSRNELPWRMDAFAGTLRGLIYRYLARGDRSLWAQAARIRVPTLVVWGAEDRLVDPALAERTAREIGDARLLVLPGVGHTAQLEAPETVARAVRGLLEDRAGGAVGGLRRA